MQADEIRLNELLDALGPEEPACLFSTSGGELSIINRSPHFSEAHALSLFDEAKSCAANLSCDTWTSILPGPQTMEIAWTATNLRGGAYRLARGKSGRMLGTGVAAGYIASWRQFVVPGLSQDTPLGPMDSWSPTLLSYVGATLASSHPVLLAWGPNQVLIYNEAYSRQIHLKHPKILGMTYREAWPEVWSFLDAPVTNAFHGRGTSADDNLMYLQRGNLMEECYFSWSMIPIQDESQAVCAIWIPNFDRSRAVISQRRIEFLRDFGLQLSLSSTLSGLYERAIKAFQTLGHDFPAVALYDCSASSLASDLASNSSAAEIDSKDSNTKSSSSIDPVRLNFHLAASFGWDVNNENIFPPHIEGQDMVDGYQEEPEGHPSFRQYITQAPYSKSLQIVDKEHVRYFASKTPKTILGDDINEMVVIPIRSNEIRLRAVAVVGLNPRKALDSDYMTFLEVCQRTLSNAIASTLLFNEDLRRTQALAALNRRKNEELQVLLAARTKELRSSESRFQTMASISPAGMFTASEGRVTYANDAWFDISGVPRDVDPTRFMEFVHNDWLDYATKIWAFAATDPRGPEPCEFRWRIDHSDGRERWSMAISKPELDEHGNIIMIAGCLLDISQRKQNETYQQRRIVEAEEHKRQQDAFLDFISHELRNPLSAILLASEHGIEQLETIAAAIPNDSPLQGECIECNGDLKIVAHCTQHMTRLIDDTLTLSKLDNNFLMVTQIPSQPDQFISDAIQLFSGEMRGKGISCELIIGEGFAQHSLEYIRTDPSRLTQVLINLLTNAIKFTANSPRKQITVTLDIQRERPALKGFIAPAIPPQNGIDGLTESPMQRKRSRSPPPNHEEQFFLLVAVKDTGSGLSETEKQSLFQRWAQANSKTHIHHGGSGLGLFICARLTEKLGGGISVQGQSGEGSCFTFYVRTTKCSPPVSPAAIRSDRRSWLLERNSSDGMATRDRPLSVLVCEDNIINQRLLVKQLTKAGCLTHVANHGQEAIDFLMTSRNAVVNGPQVDCILMDIEMPVMDGLTATRRIRQLEKDGTLKSHIPIIGVSANARQEQRQGMLEAGMSTSISKPFSMRDLVKTMQRLLGLDTDEAQLAS